MKRLILSALVAASTALAAAELQNAAQVDFGATATFSGAPNNAAWPARNAIQYANRFARGVLFGAPMTGGTIHVKLVCPCDIERIDLQQLDYRGTMNVKKAAIAVDGKVVATVDLAELPGKFQRFPVSAKGSVVSVTCLETFPPMKLKGGKTGPNYGGWAKVQVWVKNDVASLMKAPDGYDVPRLAEAIQPTGTAAATGTKVYGRPRVSKGHPRTTWDKEDVAAYRKLLETSPEFRRQAEALKAALDKRLQKPVGVPEPLGKDADGKWKHLPDTTYGKIHNALSLDVANLGTIYQLYGEEKYAEFGKKILLAYAKAFPRYGVGARSTFRHDPSVLFDQKLGDATALIQFAVGYDFLREAKCMDAESRRLIEQDFILADARHIRSNRAHLMNATNWSAIGTAACLAAGVACDDADMVNTALWGHRWSSLPEAKRDPKNFNKWWAGDFCDKPQGIELHFSQQSIDVDGMWCEGAMGYQFMALQALVFDAEVLWHHGIDLYSYRNCALKGVFDSPILFAYPNLVSPAIHDSGNARIVGREAHLYEAGYRRYRDPAYLPILKNVSRRLAASFQQFTVSPLWDADFDDGALAENPSVNLDGVGYGVLRVTDAAGTRNLLVDYGPNRSHGHPDKLNIDLWAFGELQVPDPGTAWYETPIYKNWFRTTFAHNTVNVDMQEQNACGAELLAFTPGESCGLMRARTTEAYPGVIMDRALFLGRGYVADLFGVFSRMPRTYDLAWHPQGAAMQVPEGLKPFTLPEPRPAGYSQLTDMKSVRGKGSSRVAYDNKGVKTALVSAAGGDETDFVVAKAQISSVPGVAPETVVFQRRHAAETVFGNVFDLGGGVESVRQVGSLEEGEATLSIATKETLDVFRVNYRPQTISSTAQVSCDAQLYFTSINRNGRDVHVLMLSGGRVLRMPRAALCLASVGGAIVERTETGSYLVKNCSAIENTVDVTLGTDKKSWTLKPGETAEWLLNGARPIAEHRQTVLKKLAAEAAAKAAREKAARALRIKNLTAAAQAKLGKAGTTVVVQGEDFAGECGGAIRLNDKKTAVVGKCFTHWDGEGHAIDWPVTAPADGYYNLTLCYCTDNARRRALVVNGEPVPEAAETEIPSSGGFSNGTDNWALFTFPLPDGAGALPIRLKAGANTVRLVNVGGGGVNLDYLVVTSPDVPPARLNDSN